MRRAHPIGQQCRTITFIITESSSTQLHRPCCHSLSITDHFGPDLPFSGWVSSIDLCTREGNTCHIQTDLCLGIFKQEPTSSTAVSLKPVYDTSTLHSVTNDGMHSSNSTKSDYHFC
uniref:AlNc14C197G8594 protein n=1 Tax=Albugo laibachii Nc14 TaxID=890382 RepID=F0WQB3_9STRA|nr:AlNc14C197G8594 [Albugo laibachii Nc14]|eukprot:CCA23521.1 AlNc14C197G8594 [Albugo laibachii Nc14]